MQKSKSPKRVLQVIVILIITWLAISIIDYACVIHENRPIFCIEFSEGYYYGLGYSFYTFQHPVTGKIEYAYYILGIHIKENFTNSAVSMECLHDYWE